MVQVVVDIAGHEKIQPAVAVIVAEGRSRGPVAQSDAGLFGDVRKGAVVIVVIKAILAEIANVDVRPSIVIVVPDGGTKTPAIVGDSRLFGDIGKSAVMIVVEQSCVR